MYIDTFFGRIIYKEWQKSDKINGYYYFHELDSDYFTITYKYNSQGLSNLLWIHIWSNFGTVTLILV